MLTNGMSITAKGMMATIDMNDNVANNLANVKLVRATYLNVFDIMNADAIVFSEAGLKATTEWLKGDK